MGWLNNQSWEQTRFYFEAHDAMRRQALSAGIGIGGSGIAIVIAFVIIINLLMSFNLYSLLPFVILISIVFLIGAIAVVHAAIKDIIIPMIRGYREYKEFKRANNSNIPDQAHKETK